MTEILKTRRLTLRTFRSADIQPVTDYVGNWNVCSKLSRVPFPYTRQMAAQWIAGHAASPDIICAIDFEDTSPVVSRRNAISDTGWANPFGAKVL